MIQDLSSTLRAILVDQSAPALVRGADVALERPGESYAPENSTINLFLFDVRENAELRGNDPVIEWNAGLSTMRRPPLRLACSYLITAWIGSDTTGEQAVLGQHQLLSETLKVFSRFPTVHSRYLRGELRDQLFPIPLSMVRGDLMRNPAEFWSAIGGKLRPSITLTATIALDVDTEPVTAHQVSSKKIDLQGADAVFQIGGTVRASGSLGPIEEVELTLLELGLHARSNASGQFSFAGVPEGHYEIQARKQGYVTTSRQVQVPGNAPTAFDLQLST